MNENYPLGASTHPNAPFNCPEIDCETPFCDDCEEEMEENGIDIDFDEESGVEFEVMDYKCRYCDNKERVQI